MGSNGIHIGLKEDFINISYHISIYLSSICNCALLSLEGRRRIIKQHS